MCSQNKSHLIIHEGAVTRPCIVRKTPPGSKYSSTSGLSPRGHLKRQAEFHASTQDEAAKEAIVGVYLNYVAYCKELGVDFVAGYYTPRNQALNPISRTERPYPIITVQKYLEKVVAAGAIELKLSIAEVVTDIRMLVIGNAFEWALRNGEVNFEENMRRSLSHYLDGTLK